MAAGTGGWKIWGDTGQSVQILTYIKNEFSGHNVEHGDYGW